MTFYRDTGSALRESLSIHDSGVVSYEANDSDKTYRRIAPGQQAVLSELIARLPFLEEDGAGPEGEYIDPVYIRCETSTGDGQDAKLDAARPSAEAAELVMLVDGWARILRQDRSAIPPGLLELAR